MNLTFVLPTLTAFLLVFFITPCVAWLAKKYGLVDDPKKRHHPAHTHKGIIPRAGGLAIYLGFALTCFLFLPLNKLLVGILVATFLVVAVGLWDDKKDLSPYFRFLTNFLAALIVIGVGVGVPYITNPLGGVLHLDTLRISFNFLGQHSLLVWADLFALFWIVWCSNMVNWSKGVDGQMPGFVAIAAVAIGLLSLRFSSHDLSQTTVTVLSFITVGVFLGFLPWNFYPQKIMPGYGGGTLAGFLLAILSILSWGKLGTAILVLGIPMADAFYTLGRRMAQGKSPFWGDRGHLHHLLLNWGWGRRKIALFYWIVSAILGVVALSLNSQQKLFTLVLVLILVGGLIVWLNFFSTFSKRPDPDSG